MGSFARFCTVFSIDIIWYTWVAPKTVRLMWVVTSIAHAQYSTTPGGLVCLNERSPWVYKKFSGIEIGMKDLVLKICNLAKIRYVFRINFSFLNLNH